MSATKTINEQIADALKSNSPTANALIINGYVVLKDLGPNDDSHEWYSKRRDFSGWQRNPEMVASATFDIERLKADIASRSIEKHRGVGRTAIVAISKILGLDVHQVMPQRERCLFAAIDAQEALAKMFGRLAVHYQKEITAHLRTQTAFKAFDETALNTLLTDSKVVEVSESSIRIKVPCGVSPDAVFMIDVPIKLSGFPTREERSSSAPQPVESPVGLAELIAQNLDD